MQLRFVALLLVAVVGLVYLYIPALAVVLGYEAGVVIPVWWLSLFPGRLSGTLTWMILWHTIVVLVVSVPFAWLIARFYKSRAVHVAFALTLFSVILMDVPIFPKLVDATPVRMKLTIAFDLIKLIGTLPLLVWLLRKLPSNNRIERTRAP